MRLQSLKTLLVGLLALAISATAQEPVKPKATSRIGTATRQVTLFSGLELQMLRAIQKKDKAGLQSMLSDDFEIAMPDSDPLAGEDWVDSVTAKDFSLKSFAIRQMSVVDLGNAAVVHFGRLQQATYQGREASGEFFVVDLWKKSDDTWKLANRYVARVGPVPPAAKAPPRPTGKQ